jgi:branched-chain amino acid transport system ATP-binding protein
MTAALSLRNLHVAYDQVAAVRGVDLDVEEGEAVAVIGSNGAGKTSLLRGIMGLARAAAAEIRFNGVSIASMRTHAIARGGIGYVPEGRELFPGLTVKEELLLGGRFLPRAEREAKLQEIHLLFPRLMERRSQITRTLSGGEQQMVAIARALMTKPRLLLLDEPSLGLAPLIARQIFDAIRTLNRQDGLTVLIVEQNANHALRLAHRGYVMVNGLITLAGTGPELLQRPEIRAAYLEGGRRA